MLYFPNNGTSENAVFVICADFYCCSRSQTRFKIDNFQWENTNLWQTKLQMLANMSQNLKFLCRNFDFTVTNNHAKDHCVICSTYIINSFLCLTNKTVLEPKNSIGLTPDIKFEFKKVFFSHSVTKEYYFQCILLISRH